MERHFVKIEKGLGPQGRIAVVRFDRGDNVNAFSQQAMRELRDVPRDFEDDLETSVVILTGSAKAFSAVICSGSVPVPRPTKIVTLTLPVVGGSSTTAVGSTATRGASVATGASVVGACVAGVPHAVIAIAPISNMLRNKISHFIAHSPLCNFVVRYVY